MKKITQSSSLVSFDEQCYALLRQIPRGKVTTYKTIAETLNSRAWRAVGSAMARNKDLVVTPCHRVVRSDGFIGDYAKGQVEKQRLLIEEGLEIRDSKIMHLSDVLFHFTIDTKNST